MKKLRDLVLDAHGIDRWKAVRTIEGDMSITGLLWARKGWPDVLRQVHVTAAGLISRLDYDAAVTGGIPTAHYLSDYRDFGGVRIATKRRAYRRKVDGTAIKDSVTVAIDITHIRLS